MLNRTGRSPARTNSGIFGTTERSSLAAIFPDRTAAERALRELRQMGFKHAWMGVARFEGPSREITTSTAERGGGISESIGRVFAGDSGRSLHAALTSHGVSEELASEIGRVVQPAQAVVTVDSEGVVDRAIEVLQAYGGKPTTQGDLDQ